MNIPNLLTILRFALIPVFILVFFSSSPNSTLYALIIFLVAGITDVLDGYIARKYNLVTKWGQAMDPLADKLMQMTVLISFTIKKFIPTWITFVVGIKETLMVAGGLFLYHRMGKVVIPANRYGKQATVLFYFAITWLVFDLPLATTIISLMAFFAAFAFLNYLKLGLKEVRERKIQNTP
ncbi:CDP-diacylglycerol--glycerol-3-phosphate 3-phosphatidyltransferase [Alkaliphilus serpentinus]|uniref:CDP-diacylglycerol--glycerol-3-phosphate 3-phosphatidyltransferase n=1 Tax=Alkaliphilus serpentinus TaxID=1482731 RepID=A0A833M824_9FIRM|nr:CDP-diacylglycerol--glycerol-3-phosphate 3-phosphatidyltransferase [Alkaliphilus serpentinus]KAB3529876.1 CDP-diacylglycerol--glycerol-3-phosphate 3-phosphatidyltransferase [Alkaliphilus serpentinus]